MKNIVQLSIVLLLFGVSDAFAGVRYAMTDIGLGILEGSTPHAYDINNNGQIVGDADTRHGQAFIFSNGSLTYLGTLGGTYSAAYSVNENGQIVGESTPSGDMDSHGFFYDGNGLMQDLGTNYTPYDINDSGQMAGIFGIPGGPNHSVLYINGNMKDIGSLNGTNYQGFPESAALRINNKGQTTGYSTANDNHDFHAYLYDGNGPMQDLGTLGGIWSDAWGINDSGQVVGWSWTNGEMDQHGFLYSGNELHDLGTLGGNQSLAEDINNVGQVVGCATTSKGDEHAFLYSGNDPMQDLNDLIDPSVEWTLEESSAINDNGQIVCTGINSSGQEHVFLLTPIPEPSCLVLLCVGVISLFFFKWKW